MAITGKELAKKLGLSAAAVSLALNNRPGVSETTRQEVLRVAKENGYAFRERMPQEAKDRGRIAFLLYRLRGAVVDQTEFFASLTDGIDVACRKAGYILDAQYLYKESLRRNLHTILAHNTKGIILLGTELMPEDFAPFEELDLPLVILDSTYEGCDKNCVMINNIEGAFLAVNYIIEKRKKQPGYLQSSFPIRNFEERADGFYKAIRQNGMAPGASVVHRLTPSMEGAYADMKTILAQGNPLSSCYFADNDLIAIGAMRAFQEAGYRIPKDIGIVGFDDISMCQLLTPALTTVNVPKQALGQAAVERLVALMNSTSSVPIKIELSTTLVKRKSL